MTEERMTERDWTFVPDKDAKPSERIASLCESAKVGVGTVEGVYRPEDAEVVVFMDEAEHEKFVAAMLRGKSVRFAPKERRIVTVEQLLDLVTRYDDAMTNNPAFANELLRELAKFVDDAVRT